MIRAALLAVRMSLQPIAALDVLRYLRVPAIVWVLRARRPAAFCRERHARRRRR